MEANTAHIIWKALLDIRLHSKYAAAGTNLIRYTSKGLTEPSPSGLWCIPFTKPTPLKVWNRRPEEQFHSATATFPNTVDPIQSHQNWRSDRSLWTKSCRCSPRDGPNLVRNDTLIAYALLLHLKLAISTIHFILFCISLHKGTSTQYGYSRPLQILCPGKHERTGRT